MAPFAFIVIGLVIGLVFRVVFLNARRMGLIPMMLIGMVGALFGGMLVGSLVDPEPRASVLGASNTIAAFIGAIVAVSIVTVLNQRRAHA